MGYLRTTLVPTTPPITGPGPTGYHEINASDGGDAAGGLLNVFDGGGQIYFAGTTPADINSLGLPQTTLTGGQQIIYPLPFNDYQFKPGVPWVFKWTPAGGAAVQFNGLPTGTPTLLTNCTYVAGVFTAITPGVEMRAEFTPTAVSGALPYINALFKAAAYLPTTNKPVICRASDEARIAEGKYFTQEYLDVLAGANLKTIRFLTWIINAGQGNSDSLARWEYRRTPAEIGWVNNKFYSGVYAGDTAGADTTYTVARPTNLPSGAWVDGDTFQANLTTAVALTTITGIGPGASNGSGGFLIRVTIPASAVATGDQVYISDSGAAVEALGRFTVTKVDTTHIDLQGTTYVNASTQGYLAYQAITVTGKPKKVFTYLDGTGGNTLTVGVATFVYNATWDVLLCRPGNSGAPFWAGITAGFPVEAMVDLCNRTNTNMWYTVPMNATDSFVASLVTLVRDTLNPDLSLYLEYCNETWQGGPQSQYSRHMGEYLGVAGAVGYTGLRAAMIFQIAKPIWTATRSAATLRRSIMFQAYGDSSIVNYTLNGSLNNPTGNARLTAYLGGGTPPNYSALGTRPVDLADVIGYATYSHSPCVAWGYPYPSTMVTPWIVATLQRWATAFNSNPNDPASLAELDEDLRQGVFDRLTITSVSGVDINVTGHGLVAGQTVLFYNSGGALPSPLVPKKIYFVRNPVAGKFSVSTTFSGTIVSLTGGTGTHTFGKFQIEAYGDSNQTPLYHSSGVIRNDISLGFGPGWEQVAASYDAYRTGAGLPLLRMENYEGGLQGEMPTAADCTNMGITVGGSAATASAALWAGLTAWKNSTYGYNYALDIAKQFMGTDPACSNTFGKAPHSRTPSWFLLPSTPVVIGRWSLLPNVIGSTPFQTYYGIAAFTGIAN